MRFFVCLSLLMVFGRTQAMMNASREQILCSSDFIVLGPVIDGVSDDCRLRYAPSDGFQCSATDAIWLTVRVEEILGRSSDESQGADSQRPDLETLRVGEDIKISARSDIDIPGQALSTEQVVQFYGGKRLFFSLSKIADQMARKFYGVKWPLSDRGWIEETIGIYGERACTGVLPGLKALMPEIRELLEQSGFGSEPNNSLEPTR